MKIGIIGIGNIGGALARHLIQAGHQVRVANSKGADGARPFADEIGAEAVDAKGAVEGVDLIIVSIPFPAIAKLPSDLFDNVPDGVPVVDTGNYYPGVRDPRIPELDAGMVESVWVSEKIGRPVIKAFNNILAGSLADLARPRHSQDRLAITVAGDDDGSKGVVMKLVDQIGFEPVDAGSLGDSWRQQPCTPGYCCDYGAEKMRRGLAAAVKGEAPEKRARLPELFAKLGSNPSQADIAAMNRAEYGFD